MDFGGKLVDFGKMLAGFWENVDKTLGMCVGASMPLRAYTGIYGHMFIKGQKPYFYTIAEFLQCYIITSIFMLFGNII